MLAWPSELLTFCIGRPGRVLRFRPRGFGFVVLFGSGLVFWGFAVCGLGCGVLGFLGCWGFGVLGLRCRLVFHVGARYSLFGDGAAETLNPKPLNLSGVSRDLCW